MRFKVSALSLFCFLSTVSAHAEQLAPHTIVVSGVGSIQVPPDHATVEIGVITPAKTTKDALKANNLEMNRVVTAIRSVGVSQSAMQTSEFDVSALHPRSNAGGEDDSRIVGYQVTNKLTVSLTDLNKVATVIDAAVGAGANNSNSVDFDVQNRSVYETKAQGLAVKNARRSAETLASAEHAGVGAMVAITNVPSWVTGNQFVPMPDIVVAQNGTPILPGLVTISASVIVIYALR